jgi:hypothetical protein
MNPAVVVSHLFFGFVDRVKVPLVPLGLKYWIAPPPDSIISEYNTLIAGGPSSIQSSGEFLIFAYGDPAAQTLSKSDMDALVTAELRDLWHPLMFELSNGVIPEAWLAEKEEAISVMANALIELRRPCKVEANWDTFRFV